MSSSTVLSLFFGFILCVSSQTLPPEEDDDSVVEISQVDAVLDRTATLPCDIEPEIREDRVYMVLWYRDSEAKPLYSFDVRGRPFTKALHWSDPKAFGPRAYFVTVSKPAALTLDGVQLHDAGVYRCRVDFRTSPTRNYAINLTVIVPPHQLLMYDNSGREISGIVGPLEERMDLVLTCEVRGGRPIPTVTWFVNERIADGHVEAVGNHIVINRLQVQNVQREQLNSTYKCQASNTKLMMPAEKTVRLELLLRPLSVIILHKPRQMIANEEYTISCEIVGSRPRAVVSWTRDNRIFRRGKVIEKANETIVETSVTFAPVPEDDGTFLKCIGDNPKLVGVGQEDSFKLNVVYPPLVSLHLGNTLNPDDIKEGDDVYFECNIKANPKQHKITWFHEGLVVTQNVSSGVIISTHSLVLQKVTRWQSGSYTCLATNPRGEGLSKPVNLKVRYAPVCMDTEIAVIGASLDEVLRVKCQVAADPSDITFVWQFNNSGESFDVSPVRFATSSGNTSELMYTPASQRDYGTLTCWGRNAIGRQLEPCLFQVIPAAKPNPLTNCTLKSATNHSVDVLEVECRAGYDGGLPQRFILEAYDPYTMKLRLNLSAIQTEFPQFKLDLSELLPSSSDTLPPSLRIVLYSQNAKGKSDKVILDDIVLNDAEKRTEGSSNINIIPIAALLTGSVLTLGIAVLLVVVLAVRKKQRHCNGSHCAHQLDSSKQPKITPQPSRPSSMLEINTGDNRYVVAYTLKPAAECVSPSIEHQPDILNTPRGAETTPPGAGGALPRPDALFTPLGARQSPTFSSYLNFVNMETANKLATLQEQNGQKIVQILNNAKKDSPSRKTEQYISERNSKIETLLSDCKNNHQKLQELDVPNHVYFTSKYYEQILRRVDETRKYLAECSKAPKPSEVNPEQDLRLRKQRVKINLLESTLNVVEKEIDEEKTKSRYETMLKKLSNSWGPIQELHEEITVYEEEFQDSYFTDDKYQQTESRYDECVAKLHATITTTNNVIKPNITLPKIELPYFRGGYEDWITFHDVFRKVIHENNSITRIEKMQYLKAHVREDASRLIQHLHISDGNYEAAWDLLVKRYQNTRLIFAKLMDQILDIPIVKGESVKQLQQLHDVTNECLKAVDNLGINTESWGPMIGRIISRKWDAETNKLYEQSLANPTYVQSLSSIMEFLERRFQSLETITITKTTSIPQQSQKFKREQEGSFKCKICEQPHYISKCPKFLSMAPEERCSIIKEKKICYNCLRHGNQEKCFSLMSCQVCNKKHHTLLHVEKFTKNKSSAVKTNANTTTVTEEIIETEAVTSNHMGQPERSVLLATALIRVKSLAGNLEYLRVLIDSGSQAAFITEEAAQLLGHPRQKIAAEISGLGENTKISKSKIHANIQARFPSQFLLPVNFLVLSKLTQLLPSQQVMSTIPSEWQNHLLADPTFHKPGPIDAILGAEEVGHILEKGLEKTMDGLLGQETKFGWILSGSIKNNTSAQILSMVSCLEEDKQLTKFWDIEEVNHSVPKPLSQADADCERHYEENVKRSSNGTYTVRTPFKCLPNLGESKPRALARFIQLEKSKLNKPSNIKLRQQYNEFLKEYLDLGHMRLLKPHEKNTGRYYIPHQPVLRECSTTTKLRVVFDASSKSTNGKSLNDNMHIGPRLQQELTDILMRWRKHCIVFTADIEKMYRQISIAKEDQMYHRILWRFNITQPIQEYALTTVTYGTAAAPYLAVKTLQTLAKDEKLTFPRAPAVAVRDFYVDDLMTRADSIEEAIELQSEMINLLESGGFNMRKWASNKQELVENLPEELRNQATSEIFQDEIKKTLGVCWAPSEDTFRFKVEITMYETITKRYILSEVAKVFDPLGWISPVVIQAKLIIQELWLQNLQWDQPVPTTIKEKWNCFYNQLKNAEQIHLPRWFHYSYNQVSRWRILQKMKKDFWNSWSTEYLSRLQQRYKWQKPQNNPSIGHIIHPDKDRNISVVTNKKSENQTLKRTIHKLIPIPTEQDTNSTEKRSPSTQNQAKTNVNTTIGTLLMLCLCFSLIPQGYASFNIKNLQPGLYVEHLGHSRVERGIFRVEVKYSQDQLKQDVFSVLNVTNQFENLCHQTKLMTETTQCVSLSHHLKEIGEEIGWTQKLLEDTQEINRRKRGLLGNLLTSVFGVNEEVYQDIDTIQQNQQELIRAEHHQTKFMVSALATFNETENRINKKLEQFRIKINKGLEAVNQMNRWFSTIDGNALNIHIINSFQMANSYITDISAHYSKLLDVRLRRGNLHDLLSPVRVKKILEDASKKLPASIKIISNPIIKTYLESDKSVIHVFSHFLLVGTNNFTLMKITPTPIKIQNGSYWETAIPSDLLAVDYNRQLYFWLTDIEGKNCIQLPANNYVCSPAAVTNMETTTDCIIDEIYQRIDPARCLLVHRTITGTVWKELYTTNAWIAVVNKPTRIAVTCNGVREETNINSTSIVQISQDCTIKTKQNILTPKRIDSVPVIASYTKQFNYSFDHMMPTSKPIQLLEPVYRNSQKLNTLSNLERDLDEELDETKWKKIQHHSMATSLVTTIVFITILVISLLIYRCYKHTKARSRHMKQSKSQMVSAHTQEMMELSPL